MSEYKLKTGKAGEKIVGAYKSIEDVVVGGYKKIEDTVVSGYKKVEDSFVETFLEKAEDGGAASRDDAAARDAESCENPGDRR